MANKIFLYNLYWNPLIHPVAREMEMIQRGGRWVKTGGDFAGNGLLWHFIRFQELLWPEKKWHRWNRLEAECYLKYRTIVELGPASSGKTNSAATNSLADYFCFPDITTVLVCSTTRERLEDRVWGEIKKYFRLAKQRCAFLAGNLIEGRQRIVTNSRFDAVEGRDFRNGVIGVPCKKGQDYVGLGDFIGIKNKRVRLVGDELHLLPRVFVDAISNLDKNPDLKVIALGNPKETTDALGVLAEPAAEFGGWDGGIDQGPGTKTWKIRRPDGICVQLPGSDSPNLDGKLGVPLITQEQIDRDVAFYGKDSLWYTMMNEGRMPRGQGSRRVLTRPLAEKFGAMKPPVWNNGERVRIGFLDAAYRGVGGDRCVFGELQIGSEVSDEPLIREMVNIISRSNDPDRARQIIALIDLKVVPINATLKDLPEDQIVSYVKQECEARMIPPENFFFDSGMRTSLVTAFSRNWSNMVNPVDCGGRPSDDAVSVEIQTACKDYYSKFITELWYSVRMVVEASQFRGMTDDVLMEFCQREWTITPGNKIEVEPKAKMKEKTGRSPDLADAVAVGVWGARQRGFKIARLGIPHRKKSERDWRDELRDRARAFAQSGQLDYST